MDTQNKNPIQIKKKNKGKFTNRCSNHGHNSVNNTYIEEGLASKMAGVRAMAQFAKNAKSFKH